MRFSEAQNRSGPDLLDGCAQGAAPAIHGMMLKT
jgi:hypothetical protein